MKANAATVLQMGVKLTVASKLTGNGAASTGILGFQQQLTVSGTERRPPYSSLLKTYALQSISDYHIKRLSSSSVIGLVMEECRVYQHHAK